MTTPRRILSDADQHALVVAAQHGNHAALRSLLYHNWGLLMRVVKHNHYTSVGVAEQDLIQYAAMGMLSAVKHWRPDHGTRFSTFVTRGMGYEVRVGYEDHETAVRLPRGAHTLRRQAWRMGVDVAAGVAAGVLPKRRYAGAVATWEPRLASTDAPVGIGESQATLGDIVAIDDGPSPEDIAAEREERAAIVARAEAILVHMERLSPAERVVVRKTILLGWTLARTGAVLGVSRERARQLRATAIMKLRVLAAGGQLPPKREVAIRRRAFHSSRPAKFTVPLPTVRRPLSVLDFATAAPPY